MNWLRNLFRSKQKKSNKVKNRDHGDTEDTIQLTPPAKTASSKMSVKTLGKMFKELECPVCFNVCVPPIETCKNGHMICPNCRLLSNVCPMCREKYTGTRNFFAEDFIQQYAKPCKFQDQGCEYIRWKGENMVPHETICRYRNIECCIPNCGKSIPYKSLLDHMIACHGVEGCEKLPTVVSFDILDPIVTSRKWLPYYLKHYGHIFFLMMEVHRPSFYIWVWIQELKKDALHKDFIFCASLKVQGGEHSLSYLWEGPVHSIRTSSAEIKKDGLCFILPESAMQHFERDHKLSILINIEKRPIPKEVSGDACCHPHKIPTADGDASRPDCHAPNAPSRQSLYPNMRQSVEDILNPFEANPVKSLYALRA